MAEAEQHLDLSTVYTARDLLRVGDIVRIQAWFGSAFAEIELIEVEVRRLGWRQRRRLRRRFGPGIYALTCRLPTRETVTLRRWENDPTEGVSSEVLRVDTTDPSKLRGMTRFMGRDEDLPLDLGPQL